MDQDIGAARQRDNLIGGLAGQDDQSLAVPTELGTVTLARLGGTAGQDSKIRGNASIRIGTPWLGWTMLPTYMMTLFSGCTPGIDAGLPGRSYSARSMPG